MIVTLDLVIYGIGLTILIGWLVAFFAGLKNKELFDPLSEKDFPLRQIYCVGYAVLEMIGYKYKSKTDRRIRREVSVLYGERYADYYLRVIHAQQTSIAFTILALAVPMYGLSGSLAGGLIIVMFTGLAYYYFGTVTEKKISNRSEVILRDFSDVVSKLALLTNAGMILSEAWNEVAYTGETPIYKEMQASVDEMNNGVAEVDALFNFGTRCIIPEIKKFTSTIIQGLLKGNKELTFMLQQQSKEVWELKKQIIKREGEKSASKLMIPIVIMFFGILIMIIVPILSNLGM